MYTTMKFFEYNHPASTWMFSSSGAESWYCHIVTLLVSILERQSLNVNRANSSDVFWRLISTIFTFMRTFISEKASKQKVLGVVS